MFSKQLIDMITSLPLFLHVRVAAPVISQPHDLSTLQETP